MEIEQTIKEFITARYDPNSDEILGCSRGTLAWEHENRHREQFNNPIIYNFAYITHLALVAGGGAMLLKGVLTGQLERGATQAGLLAIPYLFNALMAEVDAWIVGTARHLSD